MTKAKGFTADSIIEKVAEPADNWRIISDNFSNQMFSLLHLSDTMIPQMGKSAQEAYQNPIQRVASLLNDEEGEEFREAITWFAESLAEHFNKEDKNTANPAAVENQPDRQLQTSFSVTNSNVSAAFLQLLHDLLTGAPRTEDDTLRRSLLVTAVSNFEVLFGRLAEEVYKVNQAALNDSDYSFSLQQLAEFGTLEDARQFLIERRISALMRESVEGWDKWLGRAVKGVSLKEFPLDWTATREVFARRNIVVHNDGRVNRIYLSSLPSKNIGSSGLKLGATLEIDESYFSSAVQKIFALGMMLVSDVGQKLSKESAEQLQQGVLFTADMAVRRRAWIASTALSAYLLSKSLSRGTQLRAQMLNWVSRKNSGSFDEVREEVSKWDTSGLSEEFSHYKTVLLGEKEKAISLVEELIANKKLALVEVALHPAYAELHDELPSLVALRESKKKPAKKTASKRARKAPAKPAVKPQPEQTSGSTETRPESV